MNASKHSKKNSGVDQSPNIATPLAENTPQHNSQGAISMSNNSINRTPAATFLEYLDTNDAIGFASSAAANVDCGVEVSNDDWIERLIEGRASETDGVQNTLSEIEEKADYLESAASDLRGFIEGYMRFAGLVTVASEAIEAFGQARTAENRQKLLEAAEPLAGHSIRMEERLRRQIRPHVTNRKLRSRLNFGTLAWIVRDHVRIATKDAA